MQSVSGHTFVIRKEPSPIDPLSEPGKIWYAALRFLASQDGWEDTWWGLVDEAQQVYLLNEWSSSAAMEKFLNEGGLKEFLSMLGPLQDLEASPTSTDNGLPQPAHWRALGPLGLAWLEPAPLAITRIYHLQFHEGLTDATRQGLRIDLQLFSSHLHNRSQDVPQENLSQYLEAAQGAQHTSADPVSFNGLEGAWVGPTDVGTFGTDNATVGDKSNATSPVFVLICSWPDQRSEQQLLDEPDVFRSGGTTVSPRTFFDREILGRANGGVTTRTSALELLASNNLNVVAKESFSTYLARSQ